MFFNPIIQEIQAVTTPLPRSQRVLTEVLDAAVRAHPQRVFLQFGERAVSYAEFDDLAARAAAGLRAAGMQAGARLAILTRNCLEFVVAWFGAAKAGLIYVPLNTEYKGAVLAWQLKLSGASHIVTEAAYVERLAAIAAETPGLRQIFLLGGGAAQVQSQPFVISHFDDLLAFPPLVDAPKQAHSDALALSFTSGTSGPSKGVLGTHCHVITFAQDWMRSVGFQPGSAIYTPLPLFHAIAAWLGVVPALLAGGRITIAERFSASGYWDDVRRSQADVVHGVFSMVPMLMKQPPRADDADQPAQRLYLAKYDEAFEARFNCRPIEVFGSTETGIVTMTPPGEKAPAGSCGKLNRETFEMIIADGDDEPVACGVVGEILVRARQPFGMFNEYYGAPTETVAAWRNQWFHTGDNARADADGWIYFTDRKKDAIRRRGENISSWEVESVLLRHEAVLECAIVAVSSEVGEDDVKAVIVPRPGMSPEPVDIWKFCDEQMPRFWVPRFIEFRAELPKTPNHKVQKHLLRAAHGEAGTQVHERQPPAAPLRSGAGHAAG